MSLSTKILQVALTEAVDPAGTAFTLNDRDLIVLEDDTLGCKVTYERDGAKTEIHYVTESPWTIGGTSVVQGGSNVSGSSGVMFPVTNSDGKVEWINHLRISHREPWTDTTTTVTTYTKIEYNNYGARETYFHVMETMAQITATILQRNTV